MADHYAVLGLPKFTPTAEEIKKSFRKLAIKWHPDKCKAPNANDVFSRISTAYETLYDADSRRTYDRDLRSSGVTTAANTTASPGHAAERCQPYSSSNSSSSSSERFKQHMNKNRFKQRRKHNFEYSRKHTSGFDQWHYDYRQRQHAHRTRSVAPPAAPKAQILTIPRAIHPEAARAPQVEPARQVARRLG